MVGLAFAIASIAWGSFRAAGSAYNVVKKKTREQNTFTSMEDESIAYQKNHQNESLSSEPGTTSYAEIASNSSKEDHSDEEEGGRGDLPAEKAPQEPQPGTSSAKNQGKVEEEEEEVEDPYACSYHFIMMCAGLYLGMLFTNWRNQDSLNEDASNPELSHTSMWYVNLLTICSPVHAIYSPSFVLQGSNGCDMDCASSIFLVIGCSESWADDMQQPRLRVT